VSSVIVEERRTKELSELFVAAGGMFEIFPFTTDAHACAAMAIFSGSS